MFSVIKYVHRIMERTIVFGFQICHIIENMICASPRELRFSDGDHLDHLHFCHRMNVFGHSVSFDHVQVEATASKKTPMQLGRHQSYVVQLTLVPLNDRLRSLSVF
jgi:hypothetical protein